MALPRAKRSGFAQTFLPPMGEVETFNTTSLITNISVGTLPFAAENKAVTAELKLVDEPFLQQNKVKALMSMREMSGGWHSMTEWHLCVQKTAVRKLGSRGQEAG